MSTPRPDTSPAPLPATFSGTVTGGRKIARGLGFPTANIVIDNDSGIAAGVYAARVTTPDGQHHDAMAFLGSKPALNILELHLLGFEGDLYGQTLTAELVRFIRPEQKFASPADLRKQIKNDELNIRNILKIK